ncbi:Rhodopirellula transposase DDE domain-containing protein, partial [Nitrosomonas communis]
MPLLEKEKRIRQAGGGRKSVVETMEGLDEAFLAMLKNHTAGSPMDESVKWSNLSRSEMAEKLKQCGFSVSMTV